MIQRWEVACKVITHINDLISSSQSEGAGPHYPQIQKVWSSLGLVSFSLRFPGKTLILNMSKSPKFFAFFLATEKAPTEWRSKDKTQDWLRSRVAGRRLKELRASEKARVVTMVLDSPAGDDLMSVFYHLDGVSHFYYDKAAARLWTSWEGWQKNRTKAPCPEDVFASRCEVRFYGPMGVEQEIGYDEISSAVSMPGKILRRVKKSLARKRQKIVNDLAKNESLITLEAPLVRNEVDLTSGSFLEINQIKIKLPVAKDHFARRDFLFGKIKGAKKGVAITRARLGSLAQAEKEQGQELIASPYQWEFAGKKKPAPPLQSGSATVEYRLFKIGTLKAGIGLSAQGNDALRREFNKKRALWFHIEHGTSPHLIVGTENFADLSEEHLAAIGSLILHQMKSDFREISLIYTHLKNIRGVTGTAGKVIYSNIKYVKVNYIDHWETLIS